MKIFAWMAFCAFLEFGVCAVGRDKVSVSVMEGDPVTLNSSVTINPGDRIKWYFNDIRIAEITVDQSKICTDVQCNNGTERFRNRLKLDHQTGSLTIMNTRNTDSGVYQLEIISSDSSGKINNIGKSFTVNVTDVFVMEGDSIVLHPDIKIKQQDRIKWYYNDIRITEITGDQSKICTDDQCDERFRDRLKLDHQTGSLTITNTRITDEGEYKLQINNSRFRITRVKRFSVSVIGSGLSSAAVGGIISAVVLLFAAVAAVLIYYRKRQANGTGTENKDHDNDDDNNGDDKVKYSSVHQGETPANGDVS